MPINREAYQLINEQLQAKGVQLVAVSKTKPIEDIQALYDLGHRDFGENYVQELVDKHDALPKDIRWHFIGHLQSNKVKYIAPFVHLIHAVDSAGLLKEIDKQGLKHNRVIDCLLQLHIATEETKFGMEEEEVTLILNHELHELKNTRITGLMGMASFSDDMNLVRSEFQQLKTVFDQFAALPSTVNCQLLILSMGMSSDYQVAIEQGSNMVRIGSLLFGERNYNAG